MLNDDVFYELLTAIAKQAHKDAQRGDRAAREVIENMQEIFNPPRPMGRPRLGR